MKTKVVQPYCLVLGKRERCAISYKGTDNCSYVHNTLEVSICEIDLRLEINGLLLSLRDWLPEHDASGGLKRYLQKLKTSLRPYYESYFTTNKELDKIIVALFEMQGGRSLIHVRPLYDPS